LLRASGTEPLIRVMVEGDDEEVINALANEVADVIKEAA
jgi:phosphoglucosamine mutase